MPAKEIHFEREAQLRHRRRRHDDAARAVCAVKAPGFGDRRKAMLARARRRDP